MKFFKNHYLSCFIIFYLLSVTYSWIYLRNIHYEPVVISDIINLIFLNTHSYSDYYMSNVEPILYLLYILFLAVHVYYMNKRVFEDKNFYSMVIYRYRSVKSIFVKLLLQLGIVSLKMFVVNVMLYLIIMMIFSSVITDILEIVLFLIKINLYIYGLSIPLQKSCIFQSKTSQSILIYIYMIVYLILDVTINTHFITYSNNIMIDFIYIMIGMAIIEIQIGICFIENKKGKLYD